MGKRCGNYKKINYPSSFYAISYVPTLAGTYLSFGGIKVNGNDTTLIGFGFRVLYGLTGAHEAGINYGLYRPNNDRTFYNGRVQVNVTRFDTATKKADCTFNGYLLNWNTGDTITLTEGICRNTYMYVQP